MRRVPTAVAATALLVTAVVGGVSARSASAPGYQLADVGAYGARPHPPFRLGEGGGAVRARGASAPGYHPADGGAYGGRPPIAPASTGHPSDPPPGGGPPPSLTADGGSGRDARWNRRRLTAPRR